MMIGIVSFAEAKTCFTLKTMLIFSLSLVFRYQLQLN